MIGTVMLVALDMLPVDVASMLALGGGVVMLVASCAILVPVRARSTTCLRTSAGYLLGIVSSSLHAGGF